jgi:flagellar assembly factor FliW
MLIQTKSLGEIEIAELQIINFREGVLGFPEYLRYALIDSYVDPATNSASPFKWLQSLDDKELAFVVIEPALFYAGYAPKCSSEDLKKIDLKNISEAVILSIVTIPENPRNMTANLQGPILINRKNHLGIQIISQDDGHMVRHRIIAATEKEKSDIPRGEKKC